MIGEFTEKAITYENIAKANNLNLDNDMVNFIADILTLEEQNVEAIEKAEEKQRIAAILKDKNLFKEYIKEKYGTFYFSYYDKVLNTLKPQFVTRALYLCSYMNYDNILVEGNTRPRLIKERDLERILRLSRNESFKTKKELLNVGFITIGAEGQIIISEYYCKKGNISKGNNLSKTRIFNDAIREIYENAKSSEHKKIAILYKMLPYINLRHNIVCSNIEEEMKESVIPLTLKTLADALDQTNITTFKRDLLSITVGGKPAVMILGVLDKTSILVNPSIYYKGTTLEDVEYIEETINKVLCSI